MGWRKGKAKIQTNNTTNGNNCNNISLNNNKLSVIITNQPQSNSLHKKLTINGKNNTTNNNNITNKFPQ